MKPASKRLSPPPDVERYRVCIKFLTAYLKTKISLHDWAVQHGYDETTLSKWLCGRHEKNGHSSKPLGNWRENGICPDWLSLSDRALRKRIRELKQKLQASLPKPLFIPKPSNELAAELIISIREQLDTLEELVGAAGK